MRIATIVPAKYLEATRYGDYYMALAHLVLQQPEYAEFFRQQTRQRTFVLMDNGAAEASQMDNEALVQAAIRIQPHEMVLPDTIHDRDDTLEKGAEGLEYFRSCSDSISIFEHMQYMAVPQGVTLPQWAECARRMLQWPIKSIGISKFLTQRHGLEARLRAREMLQWIMDSAGKQVDVHLLGCWADPREAFEIERRGFAIRGTDSAIAYVYARGAELLDHRTARPTQHVDFEDEGPVPELLKTNIARWEAYCRGDIG